MSAPYYVGRDVTLYHGDMRNLIPMLQLTADVIVTDPPYGETTLGWDVWPIGWVTIASIAARSMWCFGSMRSLLRHSGDFRDWRLSQDVVWEKHNGSNFAADRFKRVHEHATHWYQGRWGDIYHEAPRAVREGRAAVNRRRTSSPHTGVIGDSVWVDDGTRLVRSVIRVQSMQGRADHPTQKPQDILTPLISYACPPGGTVLDPFAGSGSTAFAARALGHRAVLIEAQERYCESIAKRLAAGE